MAQNIFMPKNINSVAINITLEGIEKIKTEKKTENKTIWTIMRAFTCWMSFITDENQYTIHQMKLSKNYNELPNWRRYKRTVR